MKCLEIDRLVSNPYRALLPILVVNCELCHLDASSIASPHIAPLSLSLSLVQPIFQTVINQPRFRKFTRDPDLSWLSFLLQEEQQWEGLRETRRRASDSEERERERERETTFKMVEQGTKRERERERGGGRGRVKSETTFGDQTS